MSNPTPFQAFSEALRHHKAGRFDDAERMYRLVLSGEPSHADALHYLGVVAYQTGKADVAVKQIRASLAQRPGNAEALSNLGAALRANGQLDDAIAAFHEAVRLQPHNPEALSNLGAALMAIGKLDESIAACRQAITQRPGFAAAFKNLGRALWRKGDLPEAVATCRHAATLEPDRAEYHGDLGNMLAELGQFDEAVSECRHAISLYEKRRPNASIAGMSQVNPSAESSELYCNLSLILRDQGHLDEAVTACRDAIALHPHNARVHGILGILLKDKGELEAARSACLHAVALNPGDAESFNNLGVVQVCMCRLDDAIASFRRSVQIQPDYATGHFGLGMALLTAGEWKSGWDEYEWRFKCKGFVSPGSGHSGPLWDGAPIGNRTILLHSEQGHGDTIQFIRYAALIAERGGSVVFSCHEALQRLMHGAQGIGRWLLPGEAPPATDFHCPLLSLPRAFGTTEKSIPDSVPYLRADADEAERWRKKLSTDVRRLSVGLVWAGRPQYRNDRDRSMLLSTLAPLAEVTNVRFYSLQKGDAAGQARNPPAGLDLIDRTGELNDFADTAALIANLDLVISVDTAVAHLAGAMGKPVWTLLPFASDWRWMLDRDDSPWYPTMRLFRQKAPGDWAEVVKRVADALAQIAHSTNRGRAPNLRRFGIDRRDG